MTTVEKIKLPMPRLGETMDEGTIANWLVKPGDAFARGDALLELETDKTLVEYPALGAGTLVETMANPGDVVAVGAPIAVIETTDAWDGISTGSAAENPEPSSESRKAGFDRNKQQQAVPNTNKRRATPLARRLARQHGLSLDVIAGTGRRDRIEARDIEALLANRGTRAQTPTRFNANSSETADVFLVHGLGGAGSNWTELRGHLNRNGIKSSAPDLPGHGRNTTEASDVETLVSWLVDDLKKQNEAVHLVGHSLGGHLCARAAQEVPDRIARLTLIAPAGCGADINGAFIDGVANASTSGEIAHLMRMLGPKASSLGAEALAGMASEFSKGRLGLLASQVARGNKQLVDTLAPLNEVSSALPVQAIFGSGDAIIPKEHIFNMPPRAASHIVRSGHMPQWDCPGLLHKLLVSIGR